MLSLCSLGAFLYAINERIQRLGPGHRWADFAATGPPLLANGRDFLATCYSPERLASDLARRHFLLPDRAGAAGLGELDD